MTRDSYIGNLIGNLLEQTKEVVLEAREVECGEYMRIRVKMDITKPLVRKKKLSMEAMELVWISFSYE